MSNYEKYNTAARLICIGNSDCNVAKEMGVTPQTICNWRKKDEFKEILNTHKEELNRDNWLKLRALSHKAMNKLEELVDIDDSKVNIQAIRLILHAQGYFHTATHRYAIQEMDLENVSISSKLPKLQF